MKRISSSIKIISALFLSIFSTNLAPAMTAYASSGGTNHKIEICHATNSHTNPYEDKDVDKNGLNGHGDHTGGIWYPGVADHSWGDIIPPYTYGNTTYPGMNWTAQGQAIYNNNCNIPPVNVTPTAPTKVDVCGRANDGYIIPTTTGVKYYEYNFWGADTLLSAGFHAENDSAHIYAVAQDGYKLAGTTSWWMKDYTNADCATTPVAPSQTEVCGTANDTYTIPTTEGVYYKVNGTTKDAGTYPASGTVTIKAYAKSGYVISGTKEWTFTFSTVPCITTVTPTAPTSNEACGIQNDTYTIPSKTGVVYKVNDVVTGAGTYNGTGTVTVKAYAADATYVLDSTTEWTINFDDAPCPVTVQTSAPSFVDPCGAVSDGYSLPYVSGVIYEVNGTPTPAGAYKSNGHIEITALPAAAHITLTGDTTWNFDFTDVQCVVVDVNPLQPCVDRGAANGQFTVSVTNNLDTAAVYEVSIDGTPEQDELILPSQTHVFTFSGYAAGTYDISIEQFVFLPFSPVPPIALDDLDFPPIFQTPPFVSKTVHTGQVTLKECPQVLGDSTSGHTLSTSTTRLPAALPNTGSDGTLSNMLAILAGLITYVVITRRTVRE